jgi:hypothetical protein
MFDSSCFEHLPPDRTGRSEDQRQKNNLVEKRPDRPSPDMGAGSIAGLFDRAASPFEDSSTGTKIIPSL